MSKREHNCYLLCIYNSVGVPLFTRSLQFTHPPLSVQGLLAAALTSSENQYNTLKKIEGFKYEIHLHNEQELFLMALITQVSEFVDVHAKRIFKWLKNVIVLLAGTQDLKNQIRNDRVVRVLK